MVDIETLGLANGGVKALNEIAVAISEGKLAMCLTTRDGGRELNVADGLLRIANAIQDLATAINNLEINR